MLLPMMAVLAALLMSNTLQAQDKFPTLTFKNNRVYINSADGLDVMYIGTYKAPWKPATTTTRPAARSSCMRWASISSIRIKVSW